MLTPLQYGELACVGGVRRFWAGPPNKVVLVTMPLGTLFVDGVTAAQQKFREQYPD